LSAANGILPVNDHPGLRYGIEEAGFSNIFLTLILQTMKKHYLTTSIVLSFVLIMTGYAQQGKKAGMTYNDPGLKKVIQVAIVVKDIEASSRKWADLLGMPVPEIKTTRPGHEVKEIYRGKPSEGQVKLTFFDLGQVVLELLQPISEGTSWKEYLDKKGEGVQHLGFQVTDLAKTSTALEKAGYPVLHQGRYDGDDGTYVYHETLEDLGVVIELLHSDQKK
jgi:methylmalonyl-CoA/ethylmalonyl-CoA epimerase